MRKVSLPSTDRCCGCTACHAVCPVNAVSLQPDDEGFLQPNIDKDRCISCGKCVAVCPVLNQGESKEPLSVYAANAKNADLRMGSSSGGVFTVIARDVLARGGLVFGAGFDACTWSVVHKSARNESELDDLRGSKYVQSDMRGIYHEVKSVLDSNRQVLFSGCPCQIAGLKSFLGRRRDCPNLLTVDVICHGVPSPLAWEKYLNSRKESAKRNIKNVISRRYCLWRDFSIAVSFDGGEELKYIKDRWTDSFMLSFVQFWSLRKACFNCRFRGLRSGADITLGDYNNVSDINPEMDDDKGTSAVIINTIAGEAVFARVLSHMDVVSSSLSHLFKANPSIYCNHRVPRMRRPFFKELASSEFDELVFRLNKRRQGSLMWHLLWWMKRLIVNRELNDIKWN